MTPTAPRPVAVPKVRRVRVYTRFSHPLRKRLAAYCVAVGRSERAVIEDALGEYLARRSSDSSTGSSLDRLVEAIDREDRRHHELHRDLEILSEAFARFLRLWMTVHHGMFAAPSTPAAREAQGRQLAAGEALYKRLAAVISQQFARGHRFAHDLPEVPA